AALCIATACAQGGFPTSAPSQEARAAPPGRSASAPARVAPVAPVAARAPVATADTWPIVRGGPEQRGVAVSPLPDALTVRWQRELGESIESTAAVAGGVVYVGCDDGFLYAFALDDG